LNFQHVKNFSSASNHTHFSTTVVHDSDTSATICFFGNHPFHFSCHSKSQPCVFIIWNNTFKLKVVDRAEEIQKRATDRKFCISCIYDRLETPEAALMKTNMNRWSFNACKCKVSGYWKRVNLVILYVKYRSVYVMFCAKSIFLKHVKSTIVLKFLEQNLEQAGWTRIRFMSLISITDFCQLYIMCVKITSCHVMCFY
jgi:hypothetical protein